MNKIKWNNHKSTFFKILKTQREKSKYTDATLAVDGKFYPVHKLVMSTCSEYFSEIFEKTACKSPVIVLKDVQCRDIEALLDYIYLGEVDINQDNLASLVKTAECLRIKGLGVPDKCQTEVRKNSSGSHDDGSNYSRPPKRRRHDSSSVRSEASSPVPLTQNADTTVINSTLKNISPAPSNTEQSATAIVNSTHTPFTPSCSTTNASNTSQDQPEVVKVEVNNAEKQEIGTMIKDINKPDMLTNIDSENGYEFDVKIEHDSEIDDVTPFPENSLQQLDHTTDESLVVKVGLDDVREQDIGISQENYYIGSTSSVHDTFPNDGSDISIIEDNQEFYGAVSAVRPSNLTNVQQWPHLTAYFTTERDEGKAEHAYIATCMYCKPNVKKICIYKYTLNNISRHYKSTHPEVAEEFKEAISRGSRGKGLSHKRIYRKENFVNSHFSQL